MALEDRRSSRAIGPGSFQFLDAAGSGAVTVNATTAASLSASGTVFPLLPNQTHKIYAVSLSVVPEASAVDKILVRSMQVFVNLLDALNNVQATIHVRDENYTDPAKVGLGGFAISGAGDPILEFFSALNMVGLNGSLPNIAGFQMAYLVDVTNSDSSSHSVAALGQSLFSVNSI